MNIWYYRLLLGLACFICGGAGAAVYEIEVLSLSEEPLEGAVVYLEPLEGAAPPSAARGVMDQVDRQFDPHILVVQRGTEVSFPNSDSIKHHVYSFSDAKAFEIRLYKGASTQPIAFDRAGEVELGCNVHDWMLGYIFVVDTPYFARSDRSGTAEIDAPAGRYRVGVWHPRIQDEAEALYSEMTEGKPQRRIILKRPLLAPYFPESAGEFDDYD